MARRLNDTNALVRKGINSIPPLESDYVMGMSFSKMSPGRTSPLAPPTRHPDTGQFSGSSLRDAVDYYCSDSPTVMRGNCKPPCD